MAVVLSVALVIGGLVCIVFRVPLARAQARSQKKLGFMSPTAFKPALLIVLGVVAVSLGGALAYAILRGNVAF